MTTVNVSRSLLRKVIAHFADSIHEFREAETAPDGSIEIEAQEMIEGEERLLAELRQALASAEQPSEQGDVTDNAAHEIIIGEILKRNPVDVTADAIWRQIKPVNPPQEPFAYIVHDADIGPEPGDEIIGSTEAEELDEACLTPVCLAPPANDEAVRLLEDVYDTTYGDRCIDGESETYCRICNQEESRHAEWCCIPRIDAFLASQQQEKG